MAAPAQRSFKPANNDPARQAKLEAINQLAGFNRWAGFHVVQASEEEVTLAMPWRDEAGQYSGFLHAGVIGALLDTVCGFASVARTGQRALASHFAVNCLAPAVGKRFVARGRVVKAGRRQVYVHGELFACDDAPDEGKLVATGDVILVPITEA